MDDGDQIVRMGGRSPGSRLGAQIRGMGYGRPAVGKHLVRGGKADQMSG